MGLRSVLPSNHTIKVLASGGLMVGNIASLQSTGSISTGLTAYN